METLQGFIEFLSTTVWVHWPILMWIVVLSMLAQIVKTRICTVDLARKNVAIFWVRRIFPIILLLMGLVMGAIWPGESSPGVVGRTYNMLYFAGGSAMSITFFNVLKQWIKRKYDVEIGLLGSAYPPKP